jgi:hypothetical protein
MSKIDENEMHRRLEHLLQIKPSSQAADRAIKRVRDALMSEQQNQARMTMGLWRRVFKGPVVKLAAAIVVLFCAGYAAGRLSTPRPVDIEQLQAALEVSLKSSLEPTIKQDLYQEMERRWESVFAASCVQLKDELHQQVGRDLTDFAAQTLTASRTLTDQRLIELIQLIEAARIQDRRRVEEALQLIELNRLQDKTHFGKGLQTLVAQTAEWRKPEQN